MQKTFGTDDNKLTIGIPMLCKEYPDFLQLQNKAKCQSDISKVLFQFSSQIE